MVRQKAVLERYFPAGRIFHTRPAGNYAALRCLWHEIRVVERTNRAGVRVETRQFVCGVVLLGRCVDGLRGRGTRTWHACGTREGREWGPRRRAGKVLRWPRPMVRRKAVLERYAALRRLSTLRSSPHIDRGLRVAKKCARP
eukprot:6873363-Prymnesium_polylepis.1